MKPESKTGRWATVVVFAVAMAWVESAVVYYLRTLVDRIEPYQSPPLPLATGLGEAELVREAATLVMLLTVGILAGRTWPSRLGLSALAFGVWDIFYYVFLKMMCGWPNTILDWDVLFLLPLPWWGPVIAPVSIALLMIGWGTLSLAGEGQPESCSAGWRCWTMNGLGILVALYVFMADAIRVADQGESALRELLPTHFNWPLFALALGLMSAPVLRLLQQRWWSRPLPQAEGLPEETLTENR